MGKRDYIHFELRDCADSKREQFGIRVKDFRTKNDLTQKEVEDKLGFSKGKISLIESGSEKSGLNLEEIVRLADWMDITCDELIKGYAPENKRLAENVGLGPDAVDNLVALSKKQPELIKMLNAMIEDSRAFPLLLEAFWLYANSSLIKIHIAKLDDFPLSLDEAWKDDVAKAMAISYIQTVMKGIKNNWNDLNDAVVKSVDKRLKQFTESEFTAHLLAAEKIKRQIEAELEEERWRDAEE